MKTLETYNKNGYQFTLIARAGKHGAYKGTRSTGSTTYEVIEILHHNGREVFGKVWPAAEYAPSDRQWGTKGWTYTTEEAAMQKLNKMESL